MSTRLVRRLAKLEGKARPAAAFGLIWEGEYVSLPLEEVSRGVVGEHLAVDIRLEWEPGVVNLTARERLSSVPLDYGLVSDDEGKVIGRVADIAGELISIEYTAHNLPPGAPDEASRPLPDDHRRRPRSARGGA